MDTLLIKTKNKEELNFVTELLKRMKIEVKTFSIEEKEDFGLIKLMSEADRKQTISKEKVISKLIKK